MPEHETTAPAARIVARRRISAVWIVPIVAALAGAWVAVTKVMSEGPTITIHFKSAEGLEAGKTKVMFNGVEVGLVSTVVLSKDHRSVVATAKMAPETDDFLVEDTRLWVVRPRISGASVSGLGTLISGAYVTMDVGSSKSPHRDFTALESPPVVERSEAGRSFVLKTSDLGSLDAGTPIFFRRIKVGEVTSYSLNDDAQSLSVQIFVSAPYDQFVTENTRFWNASGVDVSLSATGLSVQSQSVLSVLIGGVAFETPVTGADAAGPAEADTMFALHQDRAAAFRPPVHDPQTYVLVFKQSVRGLVPGAPVEFRGIPIGEVVSVDAEIDAEKFEFLAPVTIRLDAQRLGVKYVDVPENADLATLRRNMIESMIAHGVRAQLASGNLLTGALFVSFDTYPDAEPATVDWSQKPARLPTMPGQLASMEESVSRILAKIEALPLDSIGKGAQKAVDELNRTLVTANGALGSAEKTLDDTGKLVQPDSPLTTQLGATLQSVNDAANSVRVLADYLERHPESLIRGKSGGSK